MKKTTYFVRVTCRATGRTVAKKFIEGYKLAQAAFPHYRENRRFEVKVMKRK